MAENIVAMPSAEEFSVAEAEAENSAYTYVHTLNRPFTFEGKTYKQITFDWGSLTGEDALSIEDEMQAAGKFVVAPTFSGQYLIRMASRASVEKVGTDMLMALPISEYNRIRSAARSFLLSSEL